MFTYYIIDIIMLLTRILNFAQILQNSTAWTNLYDIQKDSKHYFTITVPGV